MANQTQPFPTNNAASLPRDASAPPRDPDGGTPAPLGPVLVFVGLNSLGTGAVQTGVFFLLKSAYGFGVLANFVFGLLLYAAYIAGALAVGPIIRRHVDRPAEDIASGWSVRSIIGALVVVQALLGLLPQSVAWATGVRTPPVWTMWTVGIGFGVLTGMMWPIAESFLSGGRTGRALSGATGKFNIVWSAAVVGAFWLMAPLLEESPISVVTGLALVQGASVFCLRWFPRAPARHLESRGEPHPASWQRLLAWFRVLLPLGYVLCGAISPLLPSVVDRLGVPAIWMTPIASAWVTSRVVIFVIFERWHGWHGKGWMPWLAGIGLVAGFGATIGMPASLGVWALVGALALFGVGHATAYVGAIYYAMELGDAEIDAGGTHEALIGAGYAAGPVLGLIAVAGAGAQTGAGFNGWVIGLIGVVVVVVLSLGAARIRRRAT